MFYLGLDLGQTQDPSALAILEQQGPGPQSVFHARHLQRWPLLTPYPQIIADVVELVRRPELARRSGLVVDQTGVGRPVVDAFRAGGLGLTAITITGGDQATQDPETKDWRVPKRDLAGVLAVLLQNRRLQIAQALPEAATLTKELLGFRAKISTTGHDTYEAWREGVHDDLVLAVAIAVWYALKGQQSRLAGAGMAVVAGGGVKGWHPRARGGPGPDLAEAAARVGLDVRTNHHRRTRR